VYITNSLYSTWDEQFYPNGIPGVMAKVDVLDGGGIRLDRDFFVNFPGHRSHQVRLQGGDSSTDSFCFTS
jgi:methanethiol oxidase